MASHRLAPAVTVSIGTLIALCSVLYLVWRNQVILDQRTPIIRGIATDVVKLKVKVGKLETAERAHAAADDRRAAVLEQMLGMKIR